MNILLIGSTGFIGRHLLHALQAEGHTVIRAGRTPAGARDGWMAWDLAAPPADAVQRLRGIDAVVNAAGVFRTPSASGFDAVHRRGPIALFDACVATGVRRVLQISALGADADAAAEFLRSKAAADAHLLALPLDATVLQPSLVYGDDGASAIQLRALAALPLVPLPAGGTQIVQPVHVDDVVAAMVALLRAPAGAWSGRRVALVGPAPLMLRDYLARLRHGLGLPPLRSVAIPAGLMQCAARIGDHLPRLLFDSAAWRMLQQGSRADAGDMTALLGRLPRSADSFIAAAHAAPLRLQSVLAWQRPVLRLSLAAVWIATGIVSLGVYPVADSYALLARAGVPAALQPAALYGAALLDLLLGVLTLWPLHRPRWLWAAQAALIAGYTLIITFRLPEYWLHPYGPLTKNLPMLALLGLLWTLDRAAPPGTERS